MTAGQTFDIELEFDWTNPDISKDWSLTAWGVGGGDLTIAHESQTSDEFQVLDTTQDTGSTTENNSTEEQTTTEETTTTTEEETNTVVVEEETTIVEEE